MDLTPGTRILALLEEHGFLLDFLAGYAPELEKLKNPVLRNTMGRAASLEMLAAMARVPLERLMQDLAAAIRERTSQEVVVKPEQGPAVDPVRVRTLTEIIHELHQGADPARVKSRFAALVKDVSPTEISAMEQQLMAEGLPQERMKKLCDVHVALLGESLQRQAPLEVPPGHPLHTFQAENQALGSEAKALAAGIEGLGETPDEAQLALAQEALRAHLERLEQVELHYRRKENQLFPFLERHGVSGPGQVMWAIHDDVRALLKSVRAALAQGDGPLLVARGRELGRVVTEMIYKEDRILFPLALQVLSEQDWIELRRGEADIGYALVQPGDAWPPREAKEPGGMQVGAKAAWSEKEGGAEAASTAGGGAGALQALPLDTGSLSLELVNLVLRSLPVDLSVVDEEDRVRYYTDGPHRIFPRSPGVIGREVQLCHPSKSVHLVKRILEAFRSGERDVAEFWITLQGRFIHIRYFALRDAAGRYRGCLEVTQDATAIRALQGEQRLLSWAGEKSDA